MSRLDETWPYFIDGQPTSRQVADAYVKLVEERDALEERVTALTAENARLGQLLSKINELAMNPGLVLDRVQRIAALSDQSKPAGAASRGTTTEEPGGENG